MAADRTLRAFIAVPLAEDVLERLRIGQDAIRDSGLSASYPQMSSIHLTLKFLGDIDPEQVAPILESLEPKISSFEPVSLRIRGLGVFPSLSRPRVAWAGVVDAEGRLARLQSGVEEALQECGFEPEPRKFSPHITLARIKSVGNRVLFTALLGQMRDFDMGSSTVRTVNLYQSILRPEGAEYRVLGGISSSEWK